MLLVLVLKFNLFFTSIQYTTMASGFEESDAEFPIEGAQIISGFPILPPQPPMRVLRIVSRLTTERYVGNFVALVFEVAQLVRELHPTSNRWQMTVICCEVLEHMSELSTLTPIFDSTIEYVLSRMDQKERALCDCTAF